jgi:hypothetical protein
MIDKQLEKYYEARLSMFASQGWKDFIEDVEGIIESVDRISPIVDEKQLWFKKGELSNLVWLKNLEQESKSAYQQLKDEDNASL